MRVVSVKIERKPVELTAVSRCIRVSEIPRKYYEGMLLLNPNTGLTSLVFEKDANTVRIFTKDDMKKEWLVQSWGLELGDYVERIEDTKYKDIHIIDMPKLYPLSPEDRKIAKQIVDAIDRGTYHGYRTQYDRVDNIKKEIDKLKGKPKKLAKQLMEFLNNYDPVEQYNFDVSIRNFKQTKRGRLVMLDPVLDTELLREYRNRPSIIRRHW